MCLHEAVCACLAPFGSLSCRRLRFDSLCQGLSRPDRLLAMSFCCSKFPSYDLSRPRFQVFPRQSGACDRLADAFPTYRSTFLSTSSPPAARSVPAKPHKGWLNDTTCSSRLAASVLCVSLSMQNCAHFTSIHGAVFGCLRCCRGVLASASAFCSSLPCAVTP